MLVIFSWLIPDTFVHLFLDTVTVWKSLHRWILSPCLNVVHMSVINWHYLTLLSRRLQLSLISELLQNEFGGDQWECEAGQRVRAAGELQLCGGLLSGGPGADQKIPLLSQRLLSTAEVAAGSSFSLGIIVHTVWKYNLIFFSFCNRILCVHVVSSRSGRR